MWVMVAATDGIRVCIGHFGDAKHYFIYEVRKDPKPPSWRLLRTRLGMRRKSTGTGTGRRGKPLGAI